MTEDLIKVSVHNQSQYPIIKVSVHNQSQCP